MPANARHRPARRKAAEPTRPAPAAPDARDRTIDGALSAWSDNTARDLASWGLGAATAWLRTLEALRDVQLEAVREASRLQEEAAAQLASVQGAGDLAQVQLTLAQSAGQVAMRSASRLGEVATRQALDAWKDAADGLGRFQGAAWTSTAQWLGGLAQQPADPELLEAEVEHVVSPVAASPFVWPVQEASRQALTLASSAWNDWLSASNRWAAAGWGEPRA
jgi:hypothetical protein